MKAKLLFLPLALLSAFFCLAQNATLTSSNLPIVVINTNGQTIPDDPKITADMGIIFNGDGVRNNLMDTFNHYNGKIGIEIRGQSSQMFPMKSYSIELRDANDNSQDKSLFGLPKESDWVLYAPYTDKTLLRNFLAYTLSRELGHWAAACRFVEVVLNGNYAGVYVFMERIKRGSGRVPISKMGSADNEGDAVTGGYIFSIDKEPQGWFSSHSAPGVNGYRQFSYVYPKVENITDLQKAYIKSYVDSFENALAGTAFQDPQLGVRRFADLSSFMDYFFVNEVSRNIDGYRLSAYFYKDRDSKGGKIVAGPVWDYDLAFRNADYCDGDLASGWSYRFNNVCPTDGYFVPFWWDKLMTDTAFVGGLRCRWKSLRTTRLSETHLYSLIDSVVNLVAEAQQRHFQQWPVLGTYVWPNPQPIPASYAGEITALKSWLASRLQWIDANLPNAGACADASAPAVEKKAVFIYPNPSYTGTELKIQLKESQPVSVRVYDALGRVMWAGKETLPSGESTVPLNSKGWQAGLYFVWVQIAGKEKHCVRYVVH
jgi:hypothetical protein